MLRKPSEEPSLLELFRGAGSNRRSQLRIKKYKIAVLWCSFFDI